MAQNYKDVQSNNGGVRSGGLSGALCESLPLRHGHPSSTRRNLPAQNVEAVLAVRY